MEPIWGRAGQFGVFFFFSTLKTLMGQRSFVEPFSDMTVSLKPEKRVFENAPSPSLALNVIKIKPQTKRKTTKSLEVVFVALSLIVRLP